MFTDILHDLIKTEEAYRSMLKRVQATGGLLVKSIRQQYGWTQQDLAQSLGYGVPYISKIENGHYPLSKPFLQKLVILLKSENLNAN